MNPTGSFWNFRLKFVRLAQRISLRNVKKAKTAAIPIGIANSNVFMALLSHGKRQM